jgi:hypothetical protein
MNFGPSAVTKEKVFRKEKKSLKDTKEKGTSKFWEKFKKIRDAK